MPFVVPERAGRAAVGQPSWHAQDLTGARVVVVGDTAVLCCELADLMRIGRGDLESFRMPMTQVWVRSGGGWLCLAGHAGPRRP